MAPAMRRINMFFHRIFADLKIIRNLGPQCRYSSNLPSATKPKVTDQKKEKKYGQPTYKTHPHLLKHGELTPGIMGREYAIRRFKLMDAIDRYVIKNKLDFESHVVLIPSGSTMFMAKDIPYPFRQSSDFFYLTGFLEPDSVLVLRNKVEKKLPSHVSSIFVSEQDPLKEVWEGPRTSANLAPGFLKMDYAFNVNDLQVFLESIAKEDKSLCVWYDLSNSPYNPKVNKTIANFITNCRNKTVECPSTLIHELRLFKSNAEIELMKQSCKIISEAFKDTMKISYPCISEHELYAKIDYECRKRNAERLAYPPVVAGGNRANTIHYIANSQLVGEREMVLFDAGCEYHGYCSDVTRTWPVCGRFSSEQIELYEAMLQVQTDLLEICKNHIPLDSLFQNMCSLLGDKLKELKILPSTLCGEELARAAYKFCPHHVSHYLGIDVHDTHDISRSRRLKPGMVITIEPGIYIPPNMPDVPSCFRGTGIRIEDDVLITEKGIEVLTASCPKRIDEIERIIAKD